MRDKQGGIDVKDSVSALKRRVDDREEDIHKLKERVKEYQEMIFNLGIQIDDKRREIVVIQDELLKRGVQYE